MIQQISVFLENKTGTLADFTEILTMNKINLRALSLADTYDFGIVRIIVDNPYETAEILKANSYVVNITDVIAVEVEDKPGTLNKLLRVLSSAKQNTEYMYGFTGRKTNSAYMILRTTDVPKSMEVLEKAKIHLIGIEDLVNI